MTAVAYLRKSVVSSDRHLSWEVQQQQILELAARHGDHPLVLSDWGRSGRSTKHRPGYQRLLAMLEAGEVDVVYSYSLSRLARSLGDYTRLAELCRDRGVPIRLAKEGVFDYATPSGRLIVGILALFAQMEAELAQERAQDTIRLRRSRGDQVGQANYGTRPGESTERVIEAFREAGSAHGAALLLNRWGVPTRLGGPWHAKVVRGIVRRSANELVPHDVERSVRRGTSKPLAPFIFYRLLRCRCGRTLSASRTASGRAFYQCRVGYGIPGHNRNLSVQEHVVLAWARDELLHLRPPDEEILMGEEASEKREALLERRKRLGRAFVDSAVEEEEYEDEKRKIDQELAEIDAGGRIVVLGPVSWDLPAQAINEWLRALWGWIQMDERQRPVKAEWLLPAWRSDEPRPALPAVPPATA